MDYSRHASNPFGVTATPIDFSHEHAPAVQTYHGLTIVVDGSVVGKVTSWNPQTYGRGGQVVRELSNRTFGKVIDYVPGVVEEFNISFGAIEVWSDEFEKRVGFPAVFADLGDQRRPFTIYEYRFKGEQHYRTWIYMGCWFKSKQQESMEAEGDAIIKVSGEIAFVRKILG